VLKEWRAIASRVTEQKLVFVFDADKQPDVAGLLAQKPTPIPQRTVVLLVAPWKGIEDFVETRLDDVARAEYQAQRSQGVSKRILAEGFAPRLKRDAVVGDNWVAKTLVPCLECRCPPQQTVA
jgi:hypothetical protein